MIAWARDGVVPIPEGTGWEVTNDFGYRVRVTRGYLTTYSMELVECPRTRTSLGGLLSPPAAWAGHTSGTPNPAAIRPMQVESLVALTDREVGTVMLAPQPYCQVHYLVARAGRDSPGLPDDLDMVDTSLHIDGMYRAPGAASPTPFTVHTSIANGNVFDRAGFAPIRVDTGGAGARGTVRRHPGPLFPAVDFASTAERVRAGGILQSLVAGAEVQIPVE